MLAPCEHVDSDVYIPLGKFDIAGTRKHTGAYGRNSRKPMERKELARKYRQCACLSGSLSGGRSREFESPIVHTAFVRVTRSIENIKEDSEMKR